MSDNLDLPQWASSQDQPDLTMNSATVQLSGALADMLSCDLSSSDYTLLLANFQTYMAFITSGNTVARNFTLPASKRAIFMIENGGTATVSVILGTTTLTVAAGVTALFTQDGTANGLSYLLPTSGQERDIIIPFSGQPGDAQQVNIPFNRSVTLPVGLAGSNFYVGTNPTSTAVFTLYKNGSSIGTLSVSTLGVVTVTFASAVTFVAATDIFRISAPSPQDATLADFTANMLATFV